MSRTIPACMGVFCCISIAATLSCGSSDSAGGPAVNPSSTSPAGHAPGAFAISLLNVGTGTQSTADQATGAPPWPGVHPADNGSDAGVATFSMGDLKGSDDFLFLLKNVGDHPITDVALESDQAAFDVAPKTISVLAPSATSAMETVLRVRVVHGTNLSGVGHLPVLTMGANQASISLKGKTTDDQQASVDVAATFVVQVNALLADFEATVAGTPIDLMKPSGGMQGVCLFYGTGPLAIRNKGNVPLTVKSLNVGQLKPEPVATATIGQGESADVVSEGANYGALIDPGGVTFRPEVYDIVQGAFSGAVLVCSNVN